ncbi:dihydropteroate synthase [Limimonas halophila]|uniref:Dihydropteroate synthase n=1 Tax=Limimonas halophila TaxID=1082479 RepID=A0A1G7L6Y1_9PROT|nr:dihydropteroate synthase [Limimonas halophila]SDF45228.1 dihydropteroate synthase [Limimonas halophila]
MAQRIYLDPVAVTGPQAAQDSALPLAGGPLCFNACQIARRNPAQPSRVRRETLPITDLVRVEGARAWLDALTPPRPAFAGITLVRPAIMGVVNVTPDSFSDGGQRLAADTAVRDGKAMWDAGAAILDVGGESTRPGAEPVSVDEELRRALPVVQRLAEAGCRVSIDTRNARTMREAVAAGASIVNDVTGLTHDPDALAAVAELGVPVVLQHIQGDPQTMQQGPSYDDAALDVFDGLRARVEACEAAGIPRERIAIDPGIGFGKTVQHNLEIMDRLGLFQGLGCPVLLGASRKSTIAKVSRGEPADQRLAGSLAMALAGVQRGAQMLRVHDVGETAQALAVWRAVALTQAPPDAPA